MTKILKYTSYITLTALSAITLTISAAYFHLTPGLPDVGTLSDIKLQTPLRVYSKNGLLIGEFGDKRRTPIEYNDVPKTMVQAFLAAEDDQFFQHHGISPKGLSRAVFQKLTGASKQTGGSTITQQVAKNYFLSPEKTIKRKLREIFLALEMEKKLSKKAIMELYVNKIFLGHRAYGIVAAAQVYYGKPISELSTAQYAMIASLPKAPSSYNPITNPERAEIRRNWILSRMLKLKYIDKPSYQKAINETVTAQRHNVAIDVNAPYAAEMARRYALKHFGEASTTDGYRITTTLDTTLQQTAQNSIKRHLHAYDIRHGLRPFEAHIDNTNPETKKDLFKKLGTIAGIEIAIVIDNQNQQLTVERKNGESITIYWDSGLGNFKPYIDENTQGKKFNKSEDVANIGDAIRIVQNEEGLWTLTQVPAAEAALISLSPRDGGILAIVGGYDFYKSKFNRATQANRQVGSTIKPLVYSAALHHGMTAASIINDAPIVLKDAQLEGTWRPKNSGTFNGPTRLRKALYLSRNLVSIRVLRQTGINKTINFIEPFGLNRNLLPKNLSLALGSASFTPLDIATAYAAFANGGYKINPHLISEIYNGSNQLVYKASPAIACEDCLESDEIPLTDIHEEDNNAYSAPPPTYAKRIISEQVAFIMNSILQDVTRKGTAWTAGRDLKRNDIAGKTGTTNGPTDAWFSGYHPNIVTTTWLGFDDNALLGKKEFGGSAALPIWLDFMKVALENQPVIYKEPPSNIVSVLIDKDSGKLTQPGASNSMFEYIQKSQLKTLPAEDITPDIEEVELEELF